MDKGIKNLETWMKESKQKPMQFQEFFPLLRDCVLGLCYLHNKSIAHRNIKPANIFRMDENCYTIADYGEGINLSYTCDYFENINYQIGDFQL